ncbi:beta strand repeat-containing protein, partial [Filimonas zeae]
MKQYIYISLLCVLTFLSAGIQAQDANGILYVKKGGSGTGASWASPLGELADALKAATQMNAATAGTVKQIWVAAGTYLPMYPADAVTTGAATTTNRNNAFVVVNNVKIYGGFAGTETALTSRDSSRTTNQTILSGNLGGTGVNSDNAYRVVVATGALGTAEINSCIIREGNGGAFNIINVNGIDIVSSSGGGIVCKGSSGLLTSFVIANVSITDNRSNTGGGMYGQYAAPVLRNVIISENEAFQDGGGVYYTDAAPVLNKVIISGNIANSRGGGVYTSYSSPSFTNVLVSGNKANNSHGGGMYTLAPSISPVLTNVTIAGNSAGGDGGGAYALGAIPAIYNSIVYGNNGSPNAGVSPALIPSATCQYNLLQGVSASTGYHVLDGNTVDPLFRGASTATPPFTGGNYRLQSNSPAKDAGNDALYTATSGYSTTDVAGQPRFNGAIDLGAYEAQPLTAQTITVLADTTVTYGNVFTRAFSASSGLGVAVSSADNNIAEVYQDATDGNAWKIKAKKAGTVNITLSQAGNDSYAAASDVVFALTISKAALTVTAKDSTMNYSGVAFAGGNGVTYSGWVNGDDSTAALTGALTYSGTSQSATGAGIYTTIPGGLTSGNYTITYVSGKLNIILTAGANGILYVKKGSTGNGSSWTNAVGEVADALRAAAVMNGIAAGSVKQIWVAKGTYLPAYPVTAATTGAASNGNSFNSFVLVKDTKLYGGFAGNETDTVGRDFTVNTTILSGNIGDIGSRSDNAFRVVVAAGDMGEAVISGFTISDSYSTISDNIIVNGVKTDNGLGGGITVRSASLLIEDVTLTNNTNINGAAAAVYSEAGAAMANATFRRVNIFRNSSLTGGGGLYATYANVQLENVTGSFNNANATGGMFVLAQSATVHCRQSSFNDNKTRHLGGAIYCSGNAMALFYQCEFLRDTCSSSGGAFHIAGSSSIQFKNCAMEACVSSAYGAVGHINSSGAVVKILNSRVIGSYQPANTGVLLIDNGTLDVVNSTISGNKSIAVSGVSGTTIHIFNSIIYGNGGGVSASGNYNAMYSTIQGATADATEHITNADPLFVNSNNYNTAPFAGGDYRLQPTSPVVNGGYDSIYHANDTVTTDLAGNSRLMGTAIDQGAYELQLLPQSITALADTTATYGDVFSRIFIASSGLAVTVASEDNSIAEPYQDATAGNVWKIKTKKAGAVNITVSQPGNASYSAAADVVFALTIDKAALTVTAKDTTISYTGVGFAGGNGLSYSGFVNSEDSTAALTGAVTYSGTSQGAKNANTYVITPAGLSAANYAITYADGTLTIDKAALTVTAKDSSKVYDGLAYSGGNGLSYSGFVNSEDSAAALTGTVTYSGTSQGAKNVGSYVITPGGLAAANYDIAYADGTLTIDKAALTVTAKDSTKVYDGLAHSGGNGLSYSGFVNSEDSTVALTGTVTYSGTSQGAKNVASYVITPGGLAAANYAITYADG